MNTQIRPLTTYVWFTLSLFLLGWVVAGADETVDITREADAHIKIYLSCISGSITVEGWERKEVHISGTLEKDIEELKVTGDRTELDIEVKVRRGRHQRHTEAHLKLMVPLACSAEISTVNANVEASKLADKFEVNTVNGDIDVALELRVLRLQTVSGDLNLKLAAQRVSLQSVSGDIDLTGASPKLEVQTVSGDVDIEGGPWNEIDTSSVSGDLEIQAELTSDAVLDISTQSGSVTLHVSEGFEAEYDIETFSGDIDANFGPHPERKSRYAPGTELDFSIGSGEAEILISTFSGDVKLVAR